MGWMKMNNISTAFILFIVIVWVKPELIYDLNKFYIGKLILLIIISFFSYNNLVLGLLTIFVYFGILDKYKYVIEGMDNSSPPEKNKKEKIVITTNNKDKNGIDVQAIRDLVTPKNSNNFPLNKNMFKSSDDVEPFNKMK